MLNWKDYIVLITGIVLIGIGLFFEKENTSMRFFAGLGIGFLIASLFKIISKVNRKNETSTK